MKKKNVLVFGAAGFIGTYLIDELVRQHYSVYATDINEIGERYCLQNSIPYTHVDIADQNEFNKLQGKYDVVIHLAALQPANFSSKQNTPKDYIDINVNGTINILEFCRKKNTSKIIYCCSHRNTSGFWPKNKLIKEVDGRAQEYFGEYSMFSISESAAQDCVEFYRNNYSIKGILFRLPPVYGYGPHLEIFKEGKPTKTGFQTFIENAIACKPLEMWGDSSIGRDIIYVKDVVSALLAAIENDDIGGLYNITSAYKLTLKEEIETIAKVFWGNKSNPIIKELRDKAHKMDSFVYDNSKAKNDFGWTPKYNFETMLLDYKKEMSAGRFNFLLAKRNQLFKENNS